ncbi:MAG: transporter substrate-binding domain-containing protein [Planctomycetota bacterium]|jgi:polar amino acid transport system substrate-binding protein|nr:transporter substrate-binding domain-containing protein [Planctomycetota bacterium]
MRGVLALLVALFGLAAPASELVIAHEDSPVHPWVYPDGRGLDLELIQSGADRAKITVRFEVMPWKRCLAMLAAGKIDGVSSASYNQERSAYAAYPRNAAGQLDLSRCLHYDSYALYRKAGLATPSWDGEKIGGLTGAVGAQTGFSVIPQLLALGARVDDGSKDIEPIMHRVLSGRVAAAAFLSRSADHVLATDPNFRGQIERLDPPLVTKPYFLILRPGLSKALREKLWAGIADERQSDAFQAKLRLANAQD